MGPDATVHFIAWADSGQATDDGSDEWEWSDYDPVVTTPSNTTFERLAQIVDVWQQDQVRLFESGFHFWVMIQPWVSFFWILMNRAR